MRRQRASPEAQERGTGGAVPLAHCIQDVLERSGLAARLRYSSLQEVWEKLVGPEIASHTYVSAYRRGTLEITVDSSSLIQELLFCRAALVEEIGSRVRKPFIARLTFVSGAAREDDE